MYNSSLAHLNPEVWHHHTLTIRSLITRSRPITLSL